MKDSLFYLLKTILKKENFNLNFEELKLQLLSHPSYPSLHSITGVLNHFDIENLALEVAKEREILLQLPKHFIAYINSEHQKEFVLVNQLENSIELVYGDKKKNNLSIDVFLEIWSGIIVAIEKDDNKPSKTSINSKSLFNIFYFLTGIIVLGIFFYTKPSTFSSFHFILSLTGVGLSILIIKHELGFQSKTLDKICTASEATSCDAVLNSKGALIFNSFKLSDISLIYFAGLTLAWLTSITLAITTPTIILLTLLALPVTFYSLYYQYQVIKKWCPLCLGIVAILWLQCCTLFFNEIYISSIELDVTSSFILFFSFILTISLWMFVKPLLKKQQDFIKLEVEHHKFKRNFDLFNAIYSKGQFIDSELVDPNEIALGNKNTPLQLLIITNPSCYYCKETHTDLEKILNKNKDTVNVTILFNVPQDTNNISNQIASRLLEIYATESEKEIMNALHEVYKSDTDLNMWLKKWGQISDTSYSTVLQTQQEWCHKNNINFTPALYINGRQFPKEYQRSDLNYFIEDLIEQEENNLVPKFENELV